eukprot:431707-Heterocapsa_arctica.AAC.1
MPVLAGHGLRALQGARWPPARLLAPDADVGPVGLQARAGALRRRARAPQGDAGRVALPACRRPGRLEAR